MSQTVPVDVVSRSYWAYVASAMAEGLGRILDQGAAPTTIPRRVYADASEFLNLALEGATDSVSPNPSASVANYIIAADAAKSVPRSSADRAALHTCLDQYAQVLSRLAAGQGLTQADSDTAKNLQRFFSQLQQEAESEAYDRIVQFEPPRMNFRLA
jgi:hypothetical protein